MEAGRLIDGFGLRKGYDIQPSDAGQACIQAGARRLGFSFQGSMAKFMVRDEKKRVVRLNGALCGHSDSGADWEAHCAESMRRLMAILFSA